MDISLMSNNLFKSDTHRRAFHLYYNPLQGNGRSSLNAQRELVIKSGIYQADHENDNKEFRERIGKSEQKGVENTVQNVLPFTDTSTEDVLMEKRQKFVINCKYEDKDHDNTRVSFDRYVSLIERIIIWCHKLDERTPLSHYETWVTIAMIFYEFAAIPDRIVSSNCRPGYVYAFTDIYILHLSICMIFLYLVLNVAGSFMSGVPENSRKSSSAHELPHKDFPVSIIVNMNPADTSLTTDAKSPTNTKKLSMKIKEIFHRTAEPAKQNHSERQASVCQNDAISQTVMSNDADPSQGGGTNTNAVMDGPLYMQRVPTEKIVPGRIILLLEGDICPVDGIVMCVSQNEKIHVSRDMAWFSTSHLTGSTMLSVRRPVPNTNEQNFNAARSDGTPYDRLTRLNMIMSKLEGSVEIYYANESSLIADTPFDALLHLTGDPHPYAVKPENIVRAGSRLEFTDYCYVLASGTQNDIIMRSRSILEILRLKNFRSSAVHFIRGNRHAQILFIIGIVIIVAVDSYFAVLNKSYQPWSNTVLVDNQFITSEPGYTLIVNMIEKIFIYCSFLIFFNLIIVQSYRLICGLTFWSIIVKCQKQTCLGAVYSTRVSTKQEIHNYQHNRQSTSTRTGQLSGEKEADIAPEKATTIHKLPQVKPKKKIGDRLHLWGYNRLPLINNTNLFVLDQTVLIRQSLPYQFVMCWSGGLTYGDHPLMDSNEKFIASIPLLKRLKHEKYWSGFKRMISPSSKLRHFPKPCPLAILEPIEDDEEIVYLNGMENNLSMPVRVSPNGGPHPNHFTGDKNDHSSAFGDRTPKGLTCDSNNCICSDVGISLRDILPMYHNENDLTSYECMNPMFRGPVRDILRENPCFAAHWILGNVGLVEPLPSKHSNAILIRPNQFDAFFSVKCKMAYGFVPPSIDNNNSLCTPPSNEQIYTNQWSTVSDHMCKRSGSADTAVNINDRLISPRPTLKDKWFPHPLSSKDPIFAESVDFQDWRIIRDINRTQASPQEAMILAMALCNFSDVYLSDSMQKRSSANTDDNVKGGRTVYIDNSNTPLELNSRMSVTVSASAQCDDDRGRVKHRKDSNIENLLQISTRSKDKMRRSISVHSCEPVKHQSSGSLYRLMVSNDFGTTSRHTIYMNRSLTDDINYKKQWPRIQIKRRYSRQPCRACILDNLYYTRGYGAVDYRYAPFSARIVDSRSGKEKHHHSCPPIGSIYVKKTFNLRLPIRLRATNYRSPIHYESSLARSAALMGAHLISTVREDKPFFFTKQIYIRGILRTYEVFILSWPTISMQHSEMCNHKELRCLMALDPIEPKYHQYLIRPVKIRDTVEGARAQIVEKKEYGEWRYIIRAHWDDISDKVAQRPKLFVNPSNSESCAADPSNSPTFHNADLGSCNSNNLFNSNRQFFLETVDSIYANEGKSSRCKDDAETHLYERYFEKARNFARSVQSKGLVPIAYAGCHVSDDVGASLHMACELLIADQSHEDLVDETTSMRYWRKLKELRSGLELLGICVLKPPIDPCAKRTVHCLRSKMHTSNVSASRKLWLLSGDPMRTTLATALSSDILQSDDLVLWPEVVPALRIPFQAQMNIQLDPSVLDSNKFSQRSLFNSIKPSTTSLSLAGTHNRHQSETKLAFGADDILSELKLSAVPTGNSISHASGKSSDEPRETDRGNYLEGGKRVCISKEAMKVYTGRSFFWRDDKPRPLTVHDIFEMLPHLYDFPPIATSTAEAKRMWLTLLGTMYEYKYESTRDSSGDLIEPREVESNLSKRKLQEIATVKVAPRRIALIVTQRMLHMVSSCKDLRDLLNRALATADTVIGVSLTPNYKKSLLKIANEKCVVIGPPAYHMIPVFEMSVCSIAVNSDSPSSDPQSVSEFTRPATKQWMDAQVTTVLHTCDALASNLGQVRWIIVEGTHSVNIVRALCLNWWTRMLCTLIVIGSMVEVDRMIFSWFDLVTWLMSLVLILMIINDCTVQVGLHDQIERYMKEETQHADLQSCMMPGACLCSYELPMYDHQDDADRIQFHSDIAS
eukprot:GHVH01016550.1.p1 GENE.GHVH01016550.1~~GHVH01016550.1.p1  ORF type:complete len:2075 (-),score=191.34 GHVH01016550.1:5495-11560(-)